MGLRHGDAHAVHTVRERVRRILAYKGFPVSDHEMEDLEQEVMTDVWRAVTRPQFDFGAGFWGFLEVVTARRCIDWLRRKRQWDPLVEEIEDPQSDPLDRALRNEQAAASERLLAQLDPTCRQLIEMRFREGLAYSEISRSTGTSEGALRVALHRCVEKARRLLAGSSLEEI